MKLYLLLTLIAFIFLQCNNKAEKKSETVDTSEIHEIKDSVGKSIDTALNNIQPAESEANTMIANAKMIIQFIKDKNFKGVAAFVSPASGLGFSANSFIDSGDIRFSRKEVAGLWNDTRKYKFPSFDQEEPKKTFREYYSSDVYDKDFARATDIELNKLKRGPNSDIFTLRDNYPTASFVDFHIPAPKDPDRELDWATLRLVFIKEGVTWYLVHIMHDNWTP